SRLLGLLRILALLLRTRGAGALRLVAFRLRPGAGLLRLRGGGFALLARGPKALRAFRLLPGPRLLAFRLGRLRLGLDGFHAFFGLRLEGLLGRELFVEGRLEIEILLEALAEFLQLVLGGRPAEGPRGLRAHGDLRQAARLARGANGPGGR